MNRVQVKEISPSLMCSDWLHFNETIKELESSGIKWLHIDVMDGHFVPNVTFGIALINQIKAVTTMALDIHMMVDDPMLFIRQLDIGEGDMVYFHLEALKNPVEALEAIRQSGATAGLALLPETPIDALEPYIEQIGIVLQMMTVPGFFGKKMQEGMIEKVTRLREFLDSQNPDCLLSVDGSVSFLLAGDMSASGANIFVAGTSSVFNKEVNLKEGIENLKRIIQ